MLFDFPHGNAYVSINNQCDKTSPNPLLHFSAKKPPILHLSHPINHHSIAASFFFYSSSSLLSSLLLLNLMCEYNHLRLFPICEYSLLLPAPSLNTFILQIPLKLPNLTLPKNFLSFILGHPPIPNVLFL